VGEKSNPWYNPELYSNVFFRSETAYNGNKRFSPGRGGGKESTAIILRGLYFAYNVMVHENNTTVHATV
jgi:hypothetical protein